MPIQRKLKILALSVALGLMSMSSAQAVVVEVDLINNESATVFGTSFVTGASGDAFFAKGGTSGTGSGNFGTFLRFEADGVETGVSSSYGGSSNPLYNNKPGNHTYSPLISNLTVFDSSTNDNVGFDYFKLSLDLLEMDNDKEISIQNIELWTSDNENADTRKFGLDGEQKVWELGDNRIDLLEQGGGQGNSDYFALFDAALLNSGTYFYLYNVLGKIGTNGFSSSKSFDEWGAAGLGVSAVPVPASVWLFGTALLGFIGIAGRTKV
jgi:hypothetical protein